MAAPPSADLAAASSRTKCPATTLPLDILHYVFTTTYARYNASDLSTDDPDVDDFALQVSQVCQSWRNVALGTPLLWAVLALSPQDLANGFRRQLLWIERSRELDLEIWIDGEPSRDGDTLTPTVMRQIRDVLLPVVHRWSWLMLVDVPISSTQLLFDTLRNVSAPSLSRISIDPPESENLPESAWTFECLATAPKLTDVHVAMVPLNLRMPMLRAQSLKTLAFSDRSLLPDPKDAAVEILNLIKNLESLEALELHNDRDWPEIDPGNVQWIIEGGPIVHGRLQSILNIHRTLLNWLLPSLKTPKLRELSRIAPTTYPILRNMDPAPNLQKLGIFDPMVTEREEGTLLFAELLSLLPNLETLELAGFDFNDPTYFKLLSKKPHKLRTLDLIVCLGLTEEQLLDLIQSRITPEEHQITKLSGLTIMASDIALVEGMERWEASLSPHLDTFTLHVSSPTMILRPLSNA